MEYEDGWLQRRVAAAAKEFDSWPDSVKNALKLRTNKDVAAETSKTTEPVKGA